jgi:hypothetical protein
MCSTHNEDNLDWRDIEQTQVRLETSTFAGLHFRLLEALEKKDQNFMRIFNGIRKVPHHASRDIESINL